jgi:hypothetical protein
MLRANAEKTRIETTNFNFFENIDMNFDTAGTPSIVAGRCSDSVNRTPLPQGLQVTLKEHRQHRQIYTMALSKFNLSELGLKGAHDSLATFEIHTFLKPASVDPDSTDFSALVERYKAAVELWNKQERPANPSDGSVRYGEMKAPVLTLVFRSKGPTGELVEQPVTVMQSARYIYSNDLVLVQQQVELDNAFFESQGFEIIRSKIEATAYGIDGIPQSAADCVGPLADKYFEFHIKVQRKEQQPATSANAHRLSPEEEQSLRAAANKLSKQLAIPVPLSFNREKDASNIDGGASQRFLNVRFRGIGMTEIKKILKAVNQAIATDTPFCVIKTISELVVLDTCPEMDHGWIDYSPEEKAALMDVLN